MLARGVLFGLMLAACGSPEERPAPTTAVLPPTSVVETPPPSDTMEQLEELMEDELGPGFDGETEGPLRIAHVAYGAFRGRPAAALEPALLERVVRRHEPEIVQCYELALLESPELAGSFGVQWTISGLGPVIDTEITRPRMHAPDARDGGDSALRLEACVRSAFGRWTFPAPDEHMSVQASTTIELTSEPDPTHTADGHHPSFGGLDVPGS